jgi:hypothetical protein
VAPSTLSEAAAANAKIRLNIGDPFMRDKWPVSGGRLPLAMGMLLPIYRKAQSETHNVTSADNQLLLIKKPITR